MRPITVKQRALRIAKEELDSARDDLKAALGEIHHPADDFPWRNLLVEGVRGLVEDSEQIVKRCHNIAAAIDDSIVDFDGLDLMVGQAAEFTAQLGEVTPL